MKAQYSSYLQEYEIAFLSILTFCAMQGWYFRLYFQLGFVVHIGGIFLDVLILSLLLYYLKKYFEEKKNC